MKAFIWLRTLEERPKCRHGSAVVIAETPEEAVEMVRNHEAQHPEYSHHVADIMAKTTPSIVLEVTDEKPWVAGVSFADPEDE